VADHRRVAFLGAALRSSLATEGTEAASAPVRKSAVSGANLSGIEAVDLGEVELPPAGTEDFLAGASVPKNESRVRASLLTTASKVADIVRSGARPVLFGGDATVSLALLAGMLDGREVGSRIGLVAFDGMARYRTPDDMPEGDLSAMVLSLATGRGRLSLAHLAQNHFPLVQEPDVLLAGVRDATPAEAKALVKTRVVVLTPDRLEGTGGVAQFMAALGRLSHQTRDLVLHLDLSVLDPRQFQASVGMPSGGGLSLDQLKRLGAEVSSWNADGTIHLGGISVTGLDARKDPGQARSTEIARFVLRLVGTRSA
jgi:arginase family enzyme